ncbi:MAG TPA: DUF47 family protein [Candidatus Choladousia intestinipullorum]|nr:DUF47 family protein [Candidatus Choladousia intestinipullorum]
MMSKADRFYYENFVLAAEEAHKAAVYLVECLSDYKPDKIGQMLEKMHEYEHAGDTKKHEMSAALARAFVTPLEREDIALISQNIDEVSDRIEEVMQRFYVDRIEKVTPEAVAFAQKIVECCTMMKDMLKELPNFKKPAKLHDMIVALNALEEECDRMYLDATRKVKDEFDDVFDIICWREIYDKMERCADACEHVGDCVETIVMKNT